MGIQFLIKSNSESDIRSVIGDIADFCEIFPIEVGMYGLSIPTKILNSHDEKLIQEKIYSFECFDLWAGTWNKKC